MMSGFIQAADRDSLLSVGDFMSKYVAGEDATVTVM